MIWSIKSFFNRNIYSQSILRNIFISIICCYIYSEINITKFYFFSRLRFYIIILVLKVLNRPSYSKVTVVFHFYSQHQIFCEKLCSMITWFWHQIVCSSLCCDNFNFSMFFHIFEIFFESCIIHQFKKIFLKINFCFFFLDSCLY